MEKNILIIILLISAVLGCTINKTPVPIKVGLEKLGEEPLLREITLLSPYQKVWQAVTEVIKGMSGRIDVIDSQSGLITYILYKPDVELLTIGRLDSKKAKSILWWFAPHIAPFIPDEGIVEEFSTMHINCYLTGDNVKTKIFIYCIFRDGQGEILLSNGRMEKDLFRQIENKLKPT
jgi:hypothetical protein